MQLLTSETVSRNLFSTDFPRCCSLVYVIIICIYGFSNFLHPSLHTQVSVCCVTSSQQDLSIEPPISACNRLLFISSRSDDSHLYWLVGIFPQIRDQHSNSFVSEGKVDDSAVCGAALLQPKGFFRVEKFGRTTDGRQRRLSLLRI